MSTIGILGCGWLGSLLGNHLQQLGHTVRGSRTSDSGVVALQKKGIEGYRVVLEADQALRAGRFFGSTGHTLLSFPFLLSGPLPQKYDYVRENPTTTGRLGLLSDSGVFCF